MAGNEFFQSESFAMFTKIIIAVIASMGGGFIFVKFVYRIFLKYFEGFEKLNDEIYGSLEHKGLKERLDIQETKCRERHDKNKK